MTVETTPVETTPVDPWAQLRQQDIDRLTRQVGGQFADMGSYAPEDAVVSGMRAALQRHERIPLETIQDIRAFVYVTAYRKMLNVVRRKRECEKQVGAPDADRTAPTSTAPAVPVDVDEKIERLRRELTEDEQKVFDLKLAELTKPRIAEALGKTETAVTSLWRQITRKVRALFGEEE